MANTIINYCIKHSEISDLKCKDYLEIDLSKFSCGEISENFQKFSAEFQKKAKESALPQIRVKFPYKWSVFSETLKKFNYHPGLIFVEKNVTKTSKLPERLVELKDAKILEKLLKKQQTLHYKLNTDFFEKPNKFDLNGYLEELQMNYEKNRGITYGIYKKNSLIAFIGVEILNHSIYVNELFTDDKHRGLGLGKILMQASFNYTYKKSFKKIWTTLAAQNESALRFYQACRFKPVSKLFYINLI